MERGGSARTYQPGRCPTSRGGQELPTSGYLTRCCVRALPGGASLSAYLGVTAAAKVGSGGGRLSLPEWKMGEPPPGVEAPWGCVRLQDQPTTHPFWVKKGPAEAGPEVNQRPAFASRSRIASINDLGGPHI